MDPWGYTSPDDIRAVLGVSDEELEDTTISLPVYTLTLEAELRDIGPSLPAALEVVRAKDSGLRTDDETWLLKTAQLFVTFSIARQLTTGLPLFSPKEITDSKASVVRFASNPYADTIAMVREQFAVNQSRLSTAFRAVETVPAILAAPVYLLVSSPSVDPVTGA